LIKKNKTKKDFPSANNNNNNNKTKNINNSNSNKTDNYSYIDTENAGINLKYYNQEKQQNNRHFGTTRRVSRIFQSIRKVSCFFFHFIASKQNEQLIINN
jgi:hypothetical protein